MSFQTPITIKKALEGIDSKKYVLPAIQRAFVWNTSQIEQLFDSILQGYPIGSFLFWSVSSDSRKKYEFYEFIRDYDEREQSNNQKAEFLSSSEVTAILDGQQRLTALNVGLRGSYASRIKGKKKTNPDAYPSRLLYLNLLRPRNDDEDGFYEFSFLTKEDADSSNEKHWFPANKILDFKGPKDVYSYLAGKKLADNEFAYEALLDFYQAVTGSAIINFYLEEAQDLDKVLRIFIRVNSGGTKLGYSDLLLSTATAQWKSMNAREEIRRLLKQLNGLYRFSFDSDFVMKACLVLTDDITDIRFKVSNFNALNTKRIEDNWKNITTALKQAVALLRTFGFYDRTLTSANSVLPIAYYLLKIGLPASYETSNKYASDRTRIQQWLLKSLLRGVFGAHSDSVLSNLRAVIKTSHEEFPAEALAERLQQMGHPIRFNDDDIDDLLTISYGEKQAFLILSLLYPWVDYNNAFDQDHIHPQKSFSRKKLQNLGMSESDVEFCLDHYNELPNLQVLAAVPNKEKSAKPFKVWLDENYPVNADKEEKANPKRTDFCERQFIPETCLCISNFRNCFELRSAMLRERLKNVLTQSEG